MSTARKVARPAFAVALLLALSVAGCGRPKDPANPAEMKERLSDKVGVALWKVDATKEQKGQVDQLLDRLAPDLFGFQQEDREIKQAVIAALYADPVDRPALDRLRGRGTDLFDRYMRRMSDAAVELAGILTLEQRRELLDLWREWEFGE